MEIRIGCGRLATISLNESTRMNVEGIQYPSHCSITFWEDHESITIFATREQLLKFGQKIVEEIATVARFA